jgi:hypothetical protein
MYFHSLLAVPYKQEKRVVSSALFIAPTAERRTVLDGLQKASAQTYQMGSRNETEAGSWTLHISAHGART